jgi:hypothetical protein
MSDVKQPGASLSGPGSPDWNPDYSRRGFLCTLGAFALSACSGGDLPGMQAGPCLLTSGTTSASIAGGQFVHPGLLHTQADFARMVQKYQLAPWSGSWDLLINNPKVKLTYLSAPVPVIYRGADVIQNFGRLVNECVAMYGMAMRWKITGDTAWADKATSMLNGWSSTLTSLQGVDAALVAGAQGFELANIAEILRDYSGFTADNLTAVKNLLRNVFYPLSHSLLTNHLGKDPLHVNANWDLFNMAAIAATGILCDDQALFDEAVNYFKYGNGNGALRHAAYYMHPGYLCQWQESGRDQVHTMAGLAGMAALCEVAWHQGIDLYGYDNNRFLAAAEYSARANLIESGTTYHTVPYVPYKNDFYTWNTFSTLQQGDATPIWALIQNHYVNRKGIAAPYSEKKALSIRPEGGWELIAYGTLAYTLDPIGTGAPPSGLSGQVSAGAVVLSWWGSAYATSYTVKRAAVPGGPYMTLATGITDPLSYQDDSATSGTWYYVVTAATPTGESAPSNEAAIRAGIQLHTHLKFDETSGVTAFDASGNGHDGTLLPGATWSTAGKKSGALVLDGVGGHVRLPDHVMHDIGDFTIATWVYWNGTSSSQRVFDFGGGTDRYMFLTPRVGTGVVRFTMSLNGSYGERIINGAAPLPTGQWIHVAVTLSGRMGTLYVNGAAIGTNPNLFLAPFHLWETSQNWIGRSQYGTNPYFNGRIDDFRIYRGAMDAADILSLVNGPYDLSAAVRLTQQGATLNRITQKYVGGLTVTNVGGTSLTGPLQLLLTGLSAGVSLDNATGVDNGSPYLTLNGPLAAGATLNIPLTFSNPGRSVIAYTPAFARGYM